MAKKPTAVPGSPHQRAAPGMLCLSSQLPGSGLQRRRCNGTTPMAAGPKGLHLPTMAACEMAAARGSICSMQCSDMGIIEEYEQSSQGRSSGMPIGRLPAHLAVLACLPCVAQQNESC